MQPYFFPYIGYFQLINAVDKFVIYDDVNFIKQGWINRNKILSNEKSLLFSLETIGASSFKTINQIYVGNNKKKLLKTFFYAYKKSKYFDVIYPLIEKIFLFQENNLSIFIENSIISISRYLGIQTEFVTSSTLNKNDNLRNQEKIIDICQLLNASKYINSIGGRTLYDKSAFEKNGIELSFLKPIISKYTQFKNDFIPNLSIIDLMMFNSREIIKTKLNEYTLI